MEHPLGQGSCFPTFSAGWLFWVGVSAEVKRWKERFVRPLRKISQNVFKVGCS